MVDPADGCEHWGGQERGMLSTANPQMLQAMPTSIGGAMLREAARHEQGLTFSHGEPARRKATSRIIAAGLLERYPGEPGVYRITLAGLAAVREVFGDI
jgi:hypothetical protein